MLKASDYDCVKMVVPVLGEIVDSCCRNSRMAPVTSVFSSFSDLVNLLCLMRMGPSFTDYESRLLKERVNSFKIIARKTFDNNLWSRIQTPKWHILHHIVESLQSVGGL